MPNSKLSGGLIAKFLTGAAQVGVPMALEEQRARIQAMRDDKMQKYATSEREAGQTFTAGENTKERVNRSLDAASEREFTGEQNKANRGQEQQRIDIAKEQLGVTKEGQAIANKIAKFNLKRAEDQQAALEIVKNPNLDDKTRSAAIDYLNLIGVRKKENIVVKQLQDDMGNMIDDFAIFVDGKRVDQVNAPAGGAGGGDAGASAYVDLPGLPDAKSNKGRKVQDNQTGMFYRSDGNGWTEVK